MPPANLKQDIGIVQKAFNDVLEETRIELPRLKIRNQTPEEFDRYFGAWLTMRLRNALVQAGKSGWAMVFTYTTNVRNKTIELTVREESELAAILQAGAGMKEQAIKNLIAVL